MKKCNTCQVNLDTNANLCVLCGEELTDQNQEKSNSFFPKKGSSIPIRKKWNFLARLFLFISVTAGIICLIVNFLTWGGLPWGLIACGGIALLWALIGVPILENVNLNLMLIFQMLCVQIYLIMVDTIFGKIGWSFDYANPLLFVAIAITNTILVIIFRIAWRDYLITLLVQAMLGLVFFIFIWLKLVTVTWPSYAAITLSVLLTYGLFIFAKDKIFAELSRRFHL